MSAPAYQRHPEYCALCQQEPAEKDHPLCRQCRIEMAEDYETYKADWTVWEEEMHEREMERRKP